MRQCRTSVRTHSVEPLEPRRLLSVTVSGTVFHDVNGNGVRDASAGGLAGVQVVTYGIYTGRGLSPRATSDAQGRYTILADASFFHLGVEPNRSVQYLTTQPHHSIDATGDEQTLTGRDFGIDDLPTSLHVTVFSDANSNGVRDPGELQLPSDSFERDGIDVYPAGTSPTDPAAVARSMLNGYFELAPGQYTVSIETLTSRRQFLTTTPVQQTVAVNADGTTHVLFGVRERSSTYFRAFLKSEHGPMLPFTRPITHGWSAWLDYNGNGVKDAEDPTATPTGPEAAAGFVTFPNVYEGSVTLHIDPPTGADWIVPVDGTSQFSVPRHGVDITYVARVYHPQGSRYLTTDFDGDGGPDVVFRDTAAQTASVWHMRFNSRTGTADLPRPAGDGWELGATADFDGDGRTDAVWRDTTTGQNLIRRMNGVTLVEDVTLPSVAGAQWRVVGGGDFDRDGDADLVWRRADTGAATIWLMNGTKLAGFKALPKVADGNWTIAAVADFDRDGHFDLLWNHAVTNRSSMWLMNGHHVREFRGVAGPKTDWRFAGVGDFNADDQPDLLWRRTTDGRHSVWLLNAASPNRVLGYAPLALT